MNAKRLAPVLLAADQVAHGDLPEQISMEPIIEGAPFATELVLTDGDGAFFAVWACDAGIYPRVKDRRGSFMYILSGDADIIDDRDGAVHHLVPDTVILLPFGWSGRWVIRETIRKVYLHTDPAPPFREGLQPSVFADAAVTLHGELPDPSLLAGPDAHELVIFDGPDGHCAIAGVGTGSTAIGSDSFGRYIHIISGAGAIVDSDGTEQAFESGTAFALPRGWAGSWRIEESVRLFYVRTPDTADA